MSSITSTMPTPFAPPGLRRITVDEYERIIRARALNDPDRVELIDGYLVDKMGKSAEHGYATKKIIKALEALLPAGWAWRSEQPVRIPDYDEPEPDVTIVRGTDEDYEHRIPDPDDVGLLIEVSLTTLDHDRNEKLRAYARGGIPVYWTVNLVDRQIEVYTGPGPGSYGSRVDFKPGQAVPVVIDGQPLGQVAVDAILPSPPAEGNI
ncbi:MAG: Uma2 family endonuclease [Planctomycetaceae bacterium]|nr:Uma2 family endonuclease [Planctomycetaceae bacterium]MBV8312669.1 Uma2 family endonuclease [Planctomycetaceae bacterium]